MTSLENGIRHIVEAFNHDNLNCYSYCFNT